RGGLARGAGHRVVSPNPKRRVPGRPGRRGPPPRRCRRPKSGASFPPNSDSGPGSEVHFEGIEASDMPVDGVDDLALVDKDVVYLDGPARRPLRSGGAEKT